MNVPEGYVHSSNLLPKPKDLVRGYSLEEVLLTFLRMRSSMYTRQTGKSRITEQWINALCDRMEKASPKRIHDMIVSNPNLHELYRCDRHCSSETLANLQKMAVYGIPPAPHPLNTMYEEGIAFLVDGHVVLSDMLDIWMPQGSKLFNDVYAAYAAAGKGHLCKPDTTGKN